MKILYSGCFLREGFEKMGCDVTPIQLNKDLTLNEHIEISGCAPDFIFIEFFGKTDLPKSIHSCRHKLVAYCIDSPINEFWLIPLAKLFDIVYVDQLSSVAAFRQQGVDARWLPLCVSESDFRPPSPKQYFITFVGRTSEYRTKRSNLLNVIRRNYDINTAQDVSASRMLDLFATSHIVLNENFFPGLNLRFLHALSAGSLLLTERNGYGVDRYFSEGRHFLSYAPENLLAVLGKLHKAPEQYFPIARSGHEQCRRYHTSAQRAQTVLLDVQTITPTPKPSPEMLKTAEALGKYYHALRFGGKAINDSVSLLREITGIQGGGGGEAMHILGSIYARADMEKEGIELLEKAAKFRNISGLIACMKLMILCHDKPEFFKKLADLLFLLHDLNIDIRRYERMINDINSMCDMYTGCCLLCCQILYDLNVVFEPGFMKPYKEVLPDYALEYAILAFEHNMNAEVLELIIKSTRKIGLASEALPYIKKAIYEGAASNRQIALAASLAIQYYDFDFARMAAMSLKHKLLHTLHHKQAM